MRIMTRQGNKSTAPNGIDIFELPFNRIRLLKKDSLGVIRSFSLLRSGIEGNVAVERIRFVRPSMRPMLEHVYSSRSVKGVQYGLRVPRAIFVVTPVTPTAPLDGPPV